MKSLAVRLALTTCLLEIAELSGMKRDEVCKRLQKYESYFHDEILRKAEDVSPHLGAILDKRNIDDLLGPEGID